MDLGMIDPVFRWVVFGASALLAIFGALMMVTRRNPIHSALWLIVAFFSLAVIYLTLHAQFIAVAQVMVYAGAIMMLIIFVIMLIQLEVEPIKWKRVTATKIIGTLITLILFLEIVAAFGAFPGNPAKPAGVAAAQPIGDVASVGTALYGKYLFPFEIASILLLIGVVGAVVLARRSKE
jgi:NADH-quinone oxidoreductase subunit J